MLKRGIGAESKVDVVPFNYVMFQQFGKVIRKTNYLGIQFANFFLCYGYHFVSRN